jgi:hypothetical protein
MKLLQNSAARISRFLPERMLMVLGCWLLLLTISGVVNAEDIEQSELQTMPEPIFVYCTMVGFRALDVHRAASIKWAKGNRMKSLAPAGVDDLPPDLLKLQSEIIARLEQGKLDDYQTFAAEKFAECLDETKTPHELPISDTANAFIIADIAQIMYVERGRYKDKESFRKKWSSNPGLQPISSMIADMADRIFDSTLKGEEQEKDINRYFRNQYFDLVRQVREKSN